MLRTVGQCSAFKYRVMHDACMPSSFASVFELILLSNINSSRISLNLRKISIVLNQLSLPSRKSSEQSKNFAISIAF